MKLNRRQFIHLGLVTVATIQALGCSKGNTSNQAISVTEDDTESIFETETETDTELDNLKIDNTFTTIDSTLIFI